MGRRKKKTSAEDESPSAPFWMVTYGDMVTLLLTFFILLISFSIMDEKKFEMAAESLRGALGAMDSYNMPVSIITSTPYGEQDIIMEAEIAAFEQQMAAEIENGEIVVEQITNGLHIRLGSKLLFDTGEAQLKNEAIPILNSIGNLLRKNSSDVLVGGHTDNMPIHSTKYPSNWELSVARAMSVVRFMLDKAEINPRTLAAAGYGEHRPIASNETMDGRGKNRRVEFLVHWYN